MEWKLMEDDLDSEWQLADIQTPIMSSKDSSLYLKWHVASSKSEKLGTRNVTVVSTPRQEYLVSLSVVWFRCRVRSLCHAQLVMIHLTYNLNNPTSPSPNGKSAAVRV